MSVNAIVISPAWPSNDSGYGIAVHCALRQYLRVFSKVHFVGLVDLPFRGLSQWSGDNVVWSHIPVVRHPKWVRFLKSLFETLPAVTMQFAGRSIEQQVAKIIATHEQNEQRTVIIVEDIPPACLLFGIRREFPSIPVAIRSHNAISKAFDQFCAEGHLFSQLAWRLEVAKIQEFEKSVLRIADRIWAITEVDSTEYWRRFGMRCHGVFGVSVDARRYASVASGDIFNLIYVGSADLRHGKGISNFVENSWREIRSAIPQAKLLLCGTDTQRFTRAELAIEGIGFVKDERQILSKGMIFVNPQESGAGIKLKSIVAMLSGKALVSTEIGIEGVAGTNGEHFFVVRDTRELAPPLITLMKDRKLALETGERARKLASVIYGEENLTRVAEPLLQDFISMCPDR
jgi:glycosyltransferase involved in cell wall biosynthesis